MDEFHGGFNRSYNKDSIFLVSRRVNAPQATRINSLYVPCYSHIITYTIWSIYDNFLLYEKETSERKFPKFFVSVELLSWYIFY